MGIERGGKCAGIGRALASALAAAAFALFGAASAGAETLKIATLSPDGSLWMKLLREGAEQAAAQTAGRVAFKFYPGGVMGDDKAVLRKIRVGQLHGAVVTSSALVQTYADIALYSMPMAFRSAEEVDHVRQRMDGQLLAGLEGEGFVSFGIAEVGFAYAMSRSPLASLADARAAKVWVPDNDPGSARALSAFGISPIPLPIADVLGGLQTGLIDSVAVPPVGAIALQWHTQLAHVLDLPMLYIYGLLAVEGKRFKRLSESDRATVRKVMGEVVNRVNARSRSDHMQASSALASQGLTWRTAQAAQIAEWREFAARARQRMVEKGDISPPLYQTLTQHLRAYRAGG